MTFSEAVNVIDAGGTLALSIDINAHVAGRPLAAYARGSGTAALVFSYTVAEGFEDYDGIAVGANRLTGTIAAVSGGLAANLNHDAVAIDARDFLRARKDRETRAHLPQGTLVAIAGGKTVSDPGAVIARLDKAKAKYDDIILCHGGGPGVERIAVRWAERNGVHQVVCKPDWDRHGRAAPFRRNDELLNLMPKGVIAFPGSGITDNLVDKAVKLGIPVQRVILSSR